MYVCNLYVPIHADMRMGRVHVWRPEVDTECHPSLSYFLRQVLLLNLGLTVLSGMAGSKL